MTPEEARNAINTERQRQITSEGWNAAHDDAHDDGQLATAGACYYREALGTNTYRADGAPLGWPWDREWWKPKADHARNLVVSGALYTAEKNRLRRMPGSGYLKRARSARMDPKIELVVSALCNSALRSRQQEI